MNYGFLGIGDLVPWTESRARWRCDRSLVAKNEKLLFGSVWFALTYLRDQADGLLASSCIREIEEAGDSTYRGSVIRANLYIERIRVPFDRIAWLRDGRLLSLPNDLSVN